MFELAINVFFFVEYLPEFGQKMTKHVGLYHRLYVTVSKY